MAALAGTMVDQLGNAASELAENQREIQGETQGASPGKGDQLKKRQDELNSAADELLKKINEIARSLGKFNENAMEDLLKEPESEKMVWNAPVSGRQLLAYENFPSAEREEGKAAENLESLENDMKDIANKLRNIGNEALKKLVEDLRKAQEELSGMSKQEMKDSSEEIANSLGSLSNPGRDERSNITQFSNRWQSAKIRQNQNLWQLQQLQSIQLAEQFFWEEAMKVYYAEIKLQLPHPVDTDKLKSTFEELPRE